MFKQWGFLLTEIWVLLLLAALIGLLAGWIIWGRRPGSTDGMSAIEVDRLKGELDRCCEARTQDAATIAKLQGDLDGCQSDLKTAQQSAPAAAPIAAADTGSGETADYDGDGVVEGENEGSKPKLMDAPEGGQADDLKMIKGVGPKMEKLCNELGVWHFSQVASWSADEVAWVDANLKGFKGRVSRDQWVEQAKVLASGGDTEFSKRVEDGGVYD